MLRAGLAPRLGRWWHAAMPAALTLMVPFAFTTGARQLLNVVAQRIVSNDALFPAGRRHRLRARAMLFSLVLGLFAISPAVAFYARLGNLAAEGAATFGATLEAGTRFILLLTLPVGAAPSPSPSRGADGVRAPAARGRPGGGHRLAALALAPLGVALPAAGLVNFLLRPFYVRQRVRAPVALSVAFTLVTAVLYLLWAPAYGIAGLSWATAVTMGAQALVLLAWLRRAEGLDLGAVALQFARVGSAAVVAVAAARWTSDTAVAASGLDGWWSSAVTLAMGGSVALALFLALAWALGVPEVRRSRGTT
jgi:putative peptidoglycan lipid II flippase